MEKIKGRTHEYRMVMGNLESCWRYCSKEEADEKRRNPKIAGLAGAMYEVRELYTREALEAAVNAAVANCELVTGARFTVDTAAIINQLTGE